jgi:hypothetical protein
VISQEDLMTNDVVPGASPSGLAQFIEKLNLPELIAGQQEGRFLVSLQASSKFPLLISIVLHRR